ncbi:MAG: fibronectin type III domain-containing protein, partial [Candidatus Woesearchaeota archaeon]
MNKKQVIGLWIAILIAMLPVTTALSAITDVSVEAGTNYAVITWKTDEEANSIVNYGRSPATLTAAIDTIPTKEHSVVLANLEKNTQYYYEVKSGHLIDNNNFHTFTTIAQHATPLPLTLEVPEKHNGERVNINGTTRPFTEVNLFINDILIARTNTGASTKYSFFDIPLNVAVKLQKVKVEAKDQDNNVAQAEKTFFFDASPPTMTVETIPEYLSAASNRQLRISGSVDEAVNLRFVLKKKAEEGETTQEQAVAQVAAQGPFAQTVTFATDGIYTLRIEAIDEGGNYVDTIRTITVDTTPPQLIEPDLSQYHPSYNSEFTITGRISEPGKVAVIVNGEQRDEVPTSEDGSFEIDVELRRSQFEKREPIQQEATLQSERETGTQPRSESQVRSENTVELVFTDRAGNVGRTGERKIDYLVCGTSGDWDIDVTNYNPPVIPSEYFVQNIAQFAFTLNLTYRGQGKEPKVDQLLLNTFPLSVAEKRKAGIEKLDVRKAYEASPNDDKTVWYAVYDLKATGDRDQIEKVIMEIDTVRLPLLVELSYNHKINDRRVSPPSQKYCVDARIGVDKRIKEEKYPREFLKDTVEGLNSTIIVIDKILQPLKQVQLTTLVVSAGLGAIYLVNVATQKVQCEVFAGADATNKASVSAINEIYGDNDYNLPDC